MQDKDMKDKDIYNFRLQKGLMRLLLIHVGNTEDRFNKGYAKAIDDVSDLIEAVLDIDKK